MPYLRTTAANDVCVASEVNVPVRITSGLQDAWVHPGDYIIVDLNGVVCVPQELVEEILNVIPSKVLEDELCAQGIRDGRPVQEVFKGLRGK